MKVSIASGKGGTGKTTVAVNLALTIGRAQVLDCDVEDPDMAIFLHPELISVAPVNTQVPRVLAQKCTFCRACAEFCEYNAIAVLPELWLLTPELCKDCGGCYLVCPEEALVPESRSIGVIERGAVSLSLELVTGRLKPGESMPTPLIRRVKGEARADVPAILDCAPGSACPMMTAVEGTDYCILVTEPTPFGLHDLEQATQVVSLLGVPTGVVINRADLGEAAVKEFCRQQDIPVLLEIPYDAALAEAYARGEPAVHADEKWREIFERLWRDVTAAAQEASHDMNRESQR